MAEKGHPRGDTPIDTFRPTAELGLQTRAGMPIVCQIAPMYTITSPAYRNEKDQSLVDKVSI